MLLIETCATFLNTIETLMIVYFDPNSQIMLKFGIWVFNLVQERKLLVWSYRILLFSYINSKLGHPNTTKT